MQALLTRLTRLTTWGKTTVAPLSAFLRSPRGRLLLRVVGYLLMAAAFLFIALTLARSWHQVQPYLTTMNLRLLLWAQLCTLIAYLLGGVLWLLVLRAFGVVVPWQWGVMAHFIANAAKYIPGYGWQYISKGVLLREQGKGPRAISTILLTEVVLLLSSGSAAALLAGALVGQNWYYEWRVAGWLWWVGVFGVIGGTLGWNSIALRLVETRHTVSLQGHLLLWMGWIISLLGWLSFAAATLLFVNAIAEITNSLSVRVDFLQSLFALVASGIVSILVIIVPGGFGVREATLAALLIGVLPFEVATVVSILMRFSVIVSELLGLLFLPCLLRYRSTSGKPG